MPSRPFRPVDPEFDTGSGFGADTGFDNSRRFASGSGLLHSPGIATGGVVDAAAADADLTDEGPRPGPATVEGFPPDRVQRDFASWIAATRDPSELVLGLSGFDYAALFDANRLAELSKAFDQFLANRAPEAHSAFSRYRDTLGKGMSAEAVSSALLGVAPVLSEFVAKLFRIEDDRAAQIARARSDDPIWAFKRTFVKSRLAKAELDTSFRFEPAVAASVAKRAMEALDTAPALSGARSEEDLQQEEELAVAKTVVALQELEEVALRVLRAGGAVWTEALRHRSARLQSALAEILSTCTATPVQYAAPTRDDLPEMLQAELHEGRRVATLALEAIADWITVRRSDPRDPIGQWPSLHVPATRKPTELVQIRRPKPDLPELFVGPSERYRPRDGFELTGARVRPRTIEGEVDYCLLCHDRDKDACSKGMRDSKSGAYKKNSLGVELAGCPLHEKISEMHMMRREGDSLAALALICVDNPMLPGTGHRICNDCMRSCVFQKQEPVNIPQVETAVLTDVLGMPWGFEIYGLLSRWNPLDVRRPEPRPYTGKNVLVVGLGPAGYALSHHLAREGFGVVAIDALRLEPLPKELTGTDAPSPRPVYQFADLTISLDERLVLGFGGVSEYGITVRWDKNFLSALYLTLSRNPLIRMYGGVRFGGTITLEDAWKMGFDHVAIAAGSGRPTLVEVRNNLARGVRQASDFLMALQLTGAYKRSALANLQVRLPAVVIGGGLTAVDTATELLAYYTIQAEKTAARLSALEAEHGERDLRALFDDDEWAFVQEQRAHALEIMRERDAAVRENRRPDFRPLLERWGGVHVVYRKSVIDSPAYRLNHEEVEKSLEEGVNYIETLSPVEMLLDEHDAVRAVRFERMRKVEGVWKGTGETVDIDARTVCIAAGTSPNVTYARERKGSFELDEQGQFFKPHRAVCNDEGCVSVEPVRDPREGFFTSYCDGRHTVSYYGDNHPHYAGSVVKAMASAKDGFLQVAALLDKLKHSEAEIAVNAGIAGGASDVAGARAAVGEAEAGEAVVQAEARRGLAAAGEAEARRGVPAAGDECARGPGALFARCDDELVARVQSVHRLTDSILEIVIRAKAAAGKFEPGQFYRLQNYEQNALVIDGTRLAMEGIALTGAWVDKEKGLLSLIVLEMGTSSRLCALLRPGERVALMGPTGAPTEIPANGAVLLCGGGLGNAVLFSIARALKANGIRVLYFAAYKKGEDLFKREEIEAATDQVIWCTEAGAAIEPRRPEDRHVRGNIVEAMAKYGRGELGDEVVALSEVNRIIAIGSHRMMAAVQRARHGVLAKMLDPKHVGIASVNSPMQCMMKEVCAQCLQKHVDPATGQETVVFSCVNQDQPLDSVDFKHLAQRLKSNTAQEKLANAWLDGLFKRHPELPRA